MCKFSSITSTNTVQSYSNSAAKSTRKQSNPKKALSNIVVTNNNGILNCQFKRETFNFEPASIFNSVYNSWYVFLAKGSLLGGKIIILNR